MHAYPSVLSRLQAPAPKGVKDAGPSADIFCSSLSQARQDLGMNFVTCWQHLCPALWTEETV